MYGSRLGPLVRLLWNNRASVDDWGKVGVCVAASAVLSPIRAWERLWTDRAVRSVELEPPVMILGHWRSGTTHLHNVMARDDTFGVVSTLQGFFPDACHVVAPLTRRILAAAGPRTRAQDNMPFAPDAPYEEEVCIANTSVRSGLSAWIFPDRAREYFDRYVTFETASAADVRGWQQACLWALRKAAVVSGRRRLVAKNAWSTARIPQLLELFPGTKFIHIVRNPYEVFFSTLHGYRTGVRLLALRPIEPREAVDLIFECYAKLMRRHLEQRALIPAGRLVEVSHEEMKADPMATVERIYTTLGLSGFARVAPRFRAYLDSITSYQQNHYEFDPAMVDRIGREWAFAIERWGYRRLPVGSRPLG